MKQITFTQLLREPLSIFPIPEDGYEVIRRDGEGFYITPMKKEVAPLFSGEEDDGPPF